MNPEVIRTLREMLMMLSTIENNSYHGDLRDICVSLSNKLDGFDSLEKLQALCIELSDHRIHNLDTLDGKVFLGKRIQEIKHLCLYEIDIELGKTL